MKKTKYRKRLTATSVFSKDAESFQSWNATTAECFMFNLNCANCPSRQDCRIEVIHKNPYNIQNVKYAVLMTYANVGEKGLDRYYKKLAKN